MAPRERKTLSAKTRLRILKRDDFKCTNCGRSPATDPRVVLEVDHYEPVSKDGSDDDTNLKTLCRDCNRGKGNDESLNKALDGDFVNWLDQINPYILIAMANDGEVKVVANSEEFAQLIRLNRYFDGYEIEPTGDTVAGFGAGRSLGVYTLNDNGGSKTVFRLAPKDG